MNKGENKMAYETKVLLMAFANIVSKSNSIEEIYKAVQAMANVEGVMLQSLEELRKENAANSPE